MAMRLKKLVMAALASNVKAAQSMPDQGVAIIYTVKNEVFVLKAGMSGERVSTLLRHIMAVEAHAEELKKMAPDSEIKQIKEAIL